MRIQLTNTMKSSLLMRLTAPSEMTPGSIGSARECTSTGNFVVSLLLARSIGAFVAKAISITRQGLLAGQPGRGTRRYPFADIVSFLSFLVLVSLPLAVGTKKSSHINFSSLFQTTLCWQLHSVCIGAAYVNETFSLFHLYINVYMLTVLTLTFMSCFNCPASDLRYNSLSRLFTC